jgi:hypothetical protein
VVSLNLLRGVCFIWEYKNYAKVAERQDFWRKVEEKSGIKAERNRGAKKRQTREAAALKFMTTENCF